jgi:hypothetical protein
VLYFVDPTQKFIRLLGEAHMNPPDAETLNYIESRLSSRLLACSSVQSALDLLHAAKNYPGASTKVIFLDDHGLSLNGPFSEQLSASILSAVDDAGIPCIIKLVQIDLPPRSSNPVAIELPEVLPEVLPKEIQACNKLGTSDLGDVPLATARPIKINLLDENAPTTKHRGGAYHALVLPRYCCTLADLPQVRERVILAGGQRLERAVSHIHSKGLVHMDIKVE